MVDLSNYPYSAYESSKPVAGVLAALVGISLVAWLVQSIKAKFQPVRLNILPLVSHLTIFIELILRAALPVAARNSRPAFTVTSMLLAVGLRLIILANYEFLIRALGEKHKFFSAIFIVAFPCTIISGILLTAAGLLSFDSSTIDTSFQLRQASAAIILCLTALFYPVWILMKQVKGTNDARNQMTKQGIALLTISSISCLGVAIFLVVTSIPDNYVSANQQELWFYIFQLTPILVALFTWTILHPSRTLLLNDHVAYSKAHSRSLSPEI